MRRVIRCRLPVLLASTLLLGGFGFALARGENVSPPTPGSREEFCSRMQMGECPPMPRSLQESLALGDHLDRPRIVAIVTVGELLQENPERLGEGPYPTPPPGLTPDQRAKWPLLGPPVPIEPASTHYAIRLDEVLFSEENPGEDLVTLRVSGPPAPDRPGVYSRYREASFNVSGPKTHFADPWRTSVKEMGAPEATPAFIEAVRAALATPS